MSVVLEEYVNGVTYISEGYHLEIAEHYLSLALCGHSDSISLYNPVGGHTIVIHCGPNLCLVLYLRICLLLFFVV